MAALSKVASWICCLKCQPFGRQDKSKITNKKTTFSLVLPLGYKIVCQDEEEKFHATNWKTTINPIASRRKLIIKVCMRRRRVSQRTKGRRSQRPTWTGKSGDAPDQTFLIKVARSLVGFFYFTFVSILLCWSVVSPRVVQWYYDGLSGCHRDWLCQDRRFIV